MLGTNIHVHAFVFGLFQMHMLHYNCAKYRSYEEALGKPDGVLILATIVQVRTVANTCQYFFFRN